MRSVVVRSDPNLPFNRTSVELKPVPETEGGRTVMKAFNRTSVELKRILEFAYIDTSGTAFNRTSVELKPRDGGDSARPRATF